MQAKGEKLAHLLLHVSKRLILGPLPYDFKLDGAQHRIKAVKADELYKVAERQLSLMHDILYTKAPVIKNSTYGFCIRIVSGAGTAAAFVLFHQGLMQVLMMRRRPGGEKENDHYHYYCGRRHCNRADVAVTYVLLVGAVVLEGLAMVATVCSTWTELASGPVRCVKVQLMRATPPPLLSRVVRVACSSGGTTGRAPWGSFTCWSCAFAADPVQLLEQGGRVARAGGLVEHDGVLALRPRHQDRGGPGDGAGGAPERRQSSSGSGLSSSAAAARFFDSSVRRGALLEGLHLKHKSGDVRAETTELGR
jgi:hypothetical protein